MYQVQGATCLPELEHPHSSRLWYIVAPMQRDAKGADVAIIY